jgi:hypothetical protein
VIEVYFPVYDPLKRAIGEPDPELTGYAEIYATGYETDEDTDPSLPFGVGAMETVWDALVGSAGRLDKKLAWKPASHRDDGTQISTIDWEGESANLAVLISFAVASCSILAEQVGTDVVWATGVVKDGKLDDQSLHAAGKLQVFWTWCERHRRNGLFIAPISSRQEIYKGLKGRPREVVRFFDRDMPTFPLPGLAQPAVLLVPNDCVADLLVQLTGARLRLKGTVPNARAWSDPRAVSDLLSVTDPPRERRLGAYWRTLGPDPFLAQLRLWCDGRGVATEALERYALGSIFTVDTSLSYVRLQLTDLQGMLEPLSDPLQSFCDEVGADRGEITVRLAAGFLRRNLGDQLDALATLVEQALRGNPSRLQFELLVQLVRWTPALRDPIRRRSIECAQRQNASASGQRLRELVRLQRVDRLLWEVEAFQGQNILTAASIQWARRWVDLRPYLASLVGSFGAQRAEPYLELLADRQLATSPEANWCPLARALRGMIRTSADYPGIGNDDLDIAFRCSLSDADYLRLADLRDRPHALHVWLALMEEPFNEAQIATALAYFQGDSRRAILAGQCLASVIPLRRVWDRLADGERRWWVDTWPAERFTRPNVAALLQALTEGATGRDDEDLVYVRTRQQMALRDGGSVGE